VDSRGKLEITISMILAPCSETQASSSGPRRTADAIAMLSCVALDVVFAITANETEGIKLH
jgi:hypothetical protein